jgi:hypothetical protein
MRAFRPHLWSLSGKQEHFCSTRGVKCAAAIEQSKFTDSAAAMVSLRDQLALRFKNLSLNRLIDSPDRVMIKELLCFFDHGYLRVTNAHLSLEKFLPETAHSSDFSVTTALFSL